MRALHLYSGNLYGGVEALLATLARCRGLVPDMAPAFALCFEGRLSHELRSAGALVYLLGPARVARPWMVWRARRQLRHVLAAEKPDVAVCHSCWPHALFGSVVRAAGLPLVFWAHDIHSGRHWLERLASWVPPDRVVANSRATQAAVANLFPGRPSSVVYPPVAAPAVADRTAARAAVRQALGTPEERVVLIQVCRLERWKGHALLLRALGRMADLPGWECWVVGGAQRPHEKAYRSELGQLARTLGLADRVRFLGYRDDVPRLLAAADIHCQPNTGPEPFGIAFVEALYARLPVVTTRLGGAMEIVDASCGVLVAPGDVAELAAALRELVVNRAARERLGAAGPARAAAVSDPAGQMARLATIFADLFSMKRDA